MDPVYEDVWTDEVNAQRARDTGFEYRYADLATPAPARAECQMDWQAGCRSVINYEQHIHPLWNRDRGADTCTRCHGPLDDNGNLQVPMRISGSHRWPFDQEPSQFKSYRELLFPDNVSSARVPWDWCGRSRHGAANPGAGNGEPLDVPGGCLGKHGLHRPVRPTGTSCGPPLDPAELRLVYEWLDIGAQYYNDPFAVPVN